MLEITVPADEVFDETNNRFVKINREFTVHLEHSLVSISKWESKYHKSFLDSPNKTDEELKQYVRFMLISQNVSDEMFNRIVSNASIIKQINKYMQDPMTATSFSDKRITNGNQPPKKSYVTTEQIYSAMSRWQIPYTCEKWHINRLLTLIKVRRIEENGDNKLSKKDTISHYKAAKAAALAKKH